MYEAILAFSLYASTNEEIEAINRNIIAAQDRQDQALQDLLEQEVPENKACHIEINGDNFPTVVCLVSYEFI